MSYDLHIVRTPSWLEAAESPITKEEIDGLVGADSELEWSTLDYIDMRNEAGSVVRFPMIRWRGLLLQIARELKAQVVGDDGETYVLNRNWLGRERIETVRP